MPVGEKGGSANTAALRLGFGPANFWPRVVSRPFFQQGLAWQSMRRDPKILCLILVLVTVDAEWGAPRARARAPPKIRSHALVVVPHQTRSNA